MSILFFSSQIIYIYIKVRDYPIISLKKKKQLFSYKYPKLEFQHTIYRERFSILGRKVVDK